MKNGGGPAFPAPGETGYEGPSGNPVFLNWPGMTLRDYFAGQAVRALITGEMGRDGYATVHGVASDAYKVADAMLAERAK